MALVSRLANMLTKSSTWTGHFQGGVKLPPQTFNGDAYLSLAALNSLRAVGGFNILEKESGKVSP
jgi:hypothetical protein